MNFIGKNISIKHFASLKHAKRWNSSKKCSITKPTRDELDLLTSMSQSLVAFKWEIPMRYITHANYDFMVSGDTCLRGRGAYFPELKF